MFEAYDKEVSLAHLALQCRNYDVCFVHLERAHVLTQRMAGRHAYVHWLMLVAGLRRRDCREVVGQVPRMLASVLLSRLWVPFGNTGRARLNALKPMPVPEEQCQELRFMVTDDATLEGAFKTPGLRDVSVRPPYMHAGQFASLEEVIAHYMKAPAAVVGHTELAHGGGSPSGRKSIRLSEQEVTNLASFLGALSGPIVEVAKR